MIHAEEYPNEINYLPILEIDSDVPIIKRPDFEIDSESPIMPYVADEVGVVEDVIYRDGKLTADIADELKVNNSGPVKRPKLSAVTIPVTTNTSINPLYIAGAVVAIIIIYNILKK